MVRFNIGKSSLILSISRILLIDSDVVNLVVARSGAIAAQSELSVETLLDKVSQAVAERFESHFGDDIAHKSLHKERARLGEGDATRLHIEKCVLVELSHSGTVAATHIVVIDFELRLGVHLGEFRRKHIFVLW